MINTGNCGITDIYSISLVEFLLLIATHSYLFCHSIKQFVEWPVLSISLVLECAIGLTALDSL